MNQRRARRLRKLWRTDETVRDLHGRSRRLFLRRETRTEGEPPSAKARAITRASFRRMGEKSPHTGRWL